ncbi:MAG: CocE/NonD family hydrolase [Cephaloticoccus sp.]|nr:CocE/NonD family hydrolase [Cephaloticoccus sp.]MCF7760038.1 CocE/NonD family hydrolase [Cephaloticoccus sp.]
MLHVIHEHDVAVPMRDGVLLRGTLFRPDLPSRFPALLVRSPYGTSREGYERHARAGYVVYAQDTRGRYTSDGEHRSFSREDHGEDLDGYDTVEWLAVQPWCNGQVGQFGASYLGFNTWMSARARPPHLLAINAETIPPELADIDFTWGSFRPARRAHFWLTSFAPEWRRRLQLPPPHTTMEERIPWQDEAFRARQMDQLPWADIVQQLPEPLARDVTDYFDHPGRRNWRFAETVYPQLEIPNLDVTGWYDHCLSLAHLPGMQKHGGSELARRQTKVIIGPWNHPSRGLRQLAQMDFGPNAEVDLVELRLRWFDHWLKGMDNGVESWPAVQYFEMGSNAWRRAEAWPPPGKPQHWYLGGRAEASFGQLTTEPATGSVTRDHYVYDPHDPVPTLWGMEMVTVVTDRSKLAHRQDILRYRSAPLREPLTIAGNPEVELFAASSAPDTDFFVWLADEAPDGTAMEITSGMVRARHRNGLDRSDLLTPDQPEKFRLQLRPTANCFLPGHRIRVEISSSDFPNFDRNHNTGGDDLHETTLQIAQQSVYCGGEFATHIALPVIDRRMARA